MFTIYDQGLIILLVGIPDIIWTNQLAYGIRDIPYSDKRKGYQPCSAYKFRLKRFSNLRFLTIEGTDSTPIFIHSCAMPFGIHFMHWKKKISNELNTYTILQELLGAENLFLLFGAIAILALVFVVGSVPETKGLSLEEIESKILK